ncbi:hypothetical protein BBP40_006177 [Aspergillus hancockii]|nr:hypothetical protein BBP40_006177 [Aspergillus hancockii]
MSTKDLSLPKGSRIVVTGANGYIASHVVDKLLSLGYIVRGTVRTPKPWLNEYFQQKYGDNMFETAVVASFVDGDGINSVLDDVDGIIHVASDVTWNPDPKNVIPWVVKATTNILEAAAKRSAVKRVVLVSSSNASYFSVPCPEGRVVDESTWNHEAVKAAWDPNTPSEIKSLAVYAASKMEGERHAWTWVEEHQPHFTFNTVLPCFVGGKILHPEIFGSTMGYVRKLLNGDSSPTLMFPDQWYVDVEDVARLCAVGLLLEREVKSERIFAFGEQTNWFDMVAIMRQLRPNNKLIPDPVVEDVRDHTEVLPRRRAEELLHTFYGKSGFTSIRDSLEKGIEGLE